MKRVFVGISIFLALAFVTVLVIQNFTQAQAPDAPRERAQRVRTPTGNLAAMIGQALNLPASWWQISVQIGINDEQLVKARKIYKEAWKKEQDLRKERPQNREERQARAEKVRAINAEVGEKLKEILTEEQFAQYEEWEKKRQERLRQSMNRRQQRPRQRRPRQAQPEGDTNE